MIRRHFLMMILGTGIAVAQARGAAEVELVMYAVPEVLWQAKFEGQGLEQPALKKQLEEAPLAEGLKKVLSVKGVLAFDTPFVWRQGEEREFAGGWETDERDQAQPVDFVKRFVGSTVEWQQEFQTEAGKMQMILKLEHHFNPPDMQRINYANVATGAERDRLSVEYPRFETLVWEGRVTVSPQWRQVTQVLRPAGPGAAPATRYLVFIKRSGS